MGPRRPTTLIHAEAGHARDSYAVPKRGVGVPFTGHARDIHVRS